MKLRMLLLVTGVTMLLGAREAAAQLIPWEDRGFVNVSGALQGRARAADANFGFAIYEEEATVGMTRNIKGGPYLDIMAGARLWNNFGVAFQFNTRSAASDGAVTATIPDPITFDSPRSVTTTIAALEHKERWMSIMPVYMMPATDKIEVLLFAGASVVKLDHETVAITDSGIAEPGPTLTFTRTVNSRSVWGFIAGADVRYMFTKMIGAGAFVRLQSATVNYPGTNIKVEAGGPQFGGGIRIRF